MICFLAKSCVDGRWFPRGIRQDIVWCKTELSVDLHIILFEQYNFNAKKLCLVNVTEFNKDCGHV